MLVDAEGALLGFARQMEGRKDVSALVEFAKRRHLQPGNNFDLLTLHGSLHKRSGILKIGL